MSKNHRITNKLNKKALRILERNQYLTLYHKLKPNPKNFLNKAIRINQTGRPFTVSDFRHMSKSMRKKYIFELRKVKLVETLFTSGYAYYRVCGFKLDKIYEKSAKKPTGGKVTAKNSQKELSILIEEYFRDLDEPALHNIRLHLDDDFLYRILLNFGESKLKNIKNINFNNQNKSFTIIPQIFGFDGLKVKIILTPTKLVQVIVSNSQNPIAVNKAGLQNLVCYLNEIRDVLCGISKDVTPVSNWLFKRADFGRDCKKPMHQLIPEMTFHDFAGVLLRIYSKLWNDNIRRLRVEKIIKPNKTVRDYIKYALKEDIF